MTENDLRLQLSRYKKLISISNDLASMLELDALLMRIVEAAVELTDSESASILLYDERQNQLTFQAAAKPNEPNLRGLKVPVDDSLAGWIVTNRKPVIISDVTKDERYYQGISKSTGLITRSLVGVPLIAKEKINGVLEAINKINGEFSIQDQDALMTLATQAALAIENTRLFQQFDLIADFVHEIRTPLSSLNTATHLLTHPEIDEHKRNRLAETIQRETHRLADMSTNFLNIARLESGRTQFNIETFEIADLLTECSQLICEEIEIRGLEFQTRFEQDIAKVEGDRDRLKQVIINLLSNAIKYNRPGGCVILETKANLEDILIVVKDNGIGIPEKYMHKLFSKFFRVPGSERYAQGTGLGLSIVNRIVAGHGGYIDVDSVVDEGTTFTVHLPRYTHTYI
jgi:signal transduction histidine kinase